MWQSVTNYLRTFFEDFEGPTKHMYLDDVGWITTGIGNKIDPIGDALALQWQSADGSTASAATVTNAWQTVDAQRTAGKGEPQQGLALQGGNSAAMRALTAIRLSDAGLTSLFNRTAKGFEAILKSRFPAWDSYPADAQLGFMSMAWALGANFNYPKFQAAVKQSPPDWLTAAAESGWGNENPGRKAATTLLFTNAAAVQKSGADPSKLYYPAADVAAAVAAGTGGAIVGTGLGFALVWGILKWFGKV